VKRDKLDPRAEVGSLVGYCLGTKGYRIFKQGEIIISAEVHIVETARLEHPHSSQHADSWRSESAGRTSCKAASATGRRQ
jgi:hypothetical protein